MSARTRFLRFLIGFGLMTALLAASFAILIPAIHRWGATDAELAQAMPGDELIADPVVDWTHGMTIDAPPEEVWPWIAQLGDARGGFYSYTFIENQFVGLIGGEGYDIQYVNADRIHPEWQNPQPGEEIIKGGLQIREVKTGEYLLAEANDPDAMGWVWVWSLSPLDGGERTRMVIRTRIQPPPEAAGNPVVGFFMDAGGFVMEQNMMQGIKLRAEGGSEPAYIEILEIVLWLTALLAGLAGAVLFLAKKEWGWPLATGLTAVLVLVILTIVQPSILLRILLDVLLLAGVWQSLRRKKHPGNHSVAFYCLNTMMALNPNTIV